MSTFSTGFSAEHFIAESEREQAQLRELQLGKELQRSKIFTSEAQELFKAIAHHGVPVAAARVLATYLDTLEQRVQALEIAARNSKPAHLRKVETRNI